MADLELGSERSGAAHPTYWLAFLLGLEPNNILKALQAGGGLAILIGIWPVL